MVMGMMGQSKKLLKRRKSEAISKVEKIHQRIFGLFCLRVEVLILRRGTRARASFSISETMNAIFFSPHHVSCHINSPA
jgi:hypothetical protein